MMNFVWRRHSYRKYSFGFFRCILERTDNKRR